MAHGRGVEQVGQAMLKCWIFRHHVSIHRQPNPDPQQRFGRRVGFGTLQQTYQVRPVYSAQFCNQGGGLAGLDQQTVEYV